MSPNAENPLWAQTSFAEQLVGALHGVDAAYQNFLQGDVDFAGAQITDDPLGDLRNRLNVLTFYVNRVNGILTPTVTTAAFGADGYSGDPKAVRLFASSLSGVFLSLLQWGREVRACNAPRAWQPAYDALANYVRSPLASIWAFALDFQSRAETINADLVAGRTPSTTLTLTLRVTVADEDADAYMAVLQRLTPATPTKHRGLFGRS